MTDRNIALQELIDGARDLIYEIKHGPRVGMNGKQLVTVERLQAEAKISSALSDLGEYPVEHRAEDEARTPRQCLERTKRRLLGGEDG